MVMVTVSPVVVYSVRLELNYVYSVIDEVGLVESGFMISLIKQQILKLKFITLLN